MITNWAILCLRRCMPILFPTYLHSIIYKIYLCKFNQSGLFYFLSQLPAKTNQISIIFQRPTRTLKWHWFKCEYQHSTATNLTSRSSSYHQSLTHMLPIDTVRVHSTFSTTSLCLVVDCGSNIIYNFLCVSVTAAPPPRDAPHTSSPIGIRASQSPGFYRACLLLIITASVLLYYRYKWQGSSSCRSAYAELNEWVEFCFLPANELNMGRTKKKWIVSDHHITKNTPAIGLPTRYNSFLWIRQNVEEEEKLAPHLWRMNWGSVKFIKYANIPNGQGAPRMADGLRSLTLILTIS